MHVEFVNNKAEATEQGYLGYDDRRYLLVDLDDDSTISVKLPNGRRVAFGFIIDLETRYACVDIIDDTLGRTDELKVTVRGRGPTYYASKGDKVTVLSVNLAKKEKKGANND